MQHASSPRSLRRAKAIASVSVLVVALFYCWPTIRNNLDERTSREPPSWVGTLPGTGREGGRFCDIDTRLIHDGLLQAPRLRDTASWWTGTWVGQVPFYRPLTSMLFWVEWKLWGEDERPYNLLAVFLHLWAVFEFTRLAGTLFGRFNVPEVPLAMLVTGLTFVTGFLVLSDQQEIAREVYAQWKNQPDSLSLALFSLTLRTYVREPRRSGQPFLPLVFYTLVCLTKEAGVFLPLLLPFLDVKPLISPSTRRTALAKMLPFFVLMCTFLLLRGLFLRQVLGYTYGSNGSWDFRLGINILGPFSEALFVRQYYTLMMAVALLGGFVLYSAMRSWWRSSPSLHSPARRPVTLAAASLLVMLLVTAAAATAGMLDSHDPDPINALLQFWDFRIIKGALAIVIFCAAFRNTAARRPPLALFSYLWALLALALTLFSPSVLHRYYLVNAGFALLVGAGIGLVRRDNAARAGEERPD